MSRRNESELQAWVAKGTPYVPRGAPYVPGLRREGRARDPEAIATSETAAAPAAPPLSAPPAAHDVVLFGSDPKMVEPPQAQPEPPSPAPEPPDTKPKKSILARLAALSETRWWIVLPVCMAVVAVGLVRLHKGPPTVRAKDGAMIDLVSDASESGEALQSISDPPRPLGGILKPPAKIALLAPEAAELRKPASRPLELLGASETEAATDIAHLGAIPRRGLCTYVKPQAPKVSPVTRPPDAAFGASLADAAESQLSDFVVYDDEYRTIGYPGGDVASLYGVCSDVVIRAYRALGIDLQALVHEARVGSSDRSIAHRRTETLRRFFKSVGASLPVTDFPEDYLPGDVVTYARPQNRGAQDHIAVVSNIRGPSGRFMIVHNRGYGPQIEDALFVDRVTGHYRFNGQSIGQSNGQSKAKSDGADASPNGARTANPSKG